jgi:hypothetical protein
MANTKISQLPTWTGTNADIRWFVMNNQGNTETYKFSGYSAQLIVGTGTNSFRTPNATASGTNAIAIGNGAVADGQDSVSIGSSSINPGNQGIIIGKHFTGGANGILIGYGSYSAGNGIAIGRETASYANCLVVGQGLDSNRATGADGLGGGYAITVGTDNPQNTGSYSGIFGSRNRLGNFTYNSVSYNNGGTYNFIFSNNSRLGFTGVTNFTGNTIVGGNNNVIIASGSNNAIIGGGGNIISGNTSGSTVIGMTNYTPTRSNATFTPNLVMTDYINDNFADDTAAAAGGVVLGQMYHNNGAMRIRIV